MCILSCGSCLKKALDLSPLYSCLTRNYINERGVLGDPGIFAMDACLPSEQHVSILAFNPANASLKKKSCCICFIVAKKVRSKQKKKTC
jgi:hypothetical protein